MVDRELPKAEPPLFRSRDAYFLAYLPAMAAVAWLVPERYWGRVCRMGVRLSGGVRRADRAQQRDHLRELLGQLHADDADAVVEALAANHHEAALQILQCWAIGGWQPRIQLIGREHVEHALAAGRGGVLWILPCVFGNLVTKMAFHAAGFRVSHLSRSAHGFSPSRFGMRVLNPIWTAAERRYLAERLVMAPDQSVGALRELVRCVRENGLVSIAVHSEGRRTYTVPFFNGTIRVADGAPALAERTGAPLLPVFTVRAGTGTFVTTVQAALQAPRGMEHGDRVRHLVLQCAGLLESYVQRWPDQYAGWDL